MCRVYVFYCMGPKRKLVKYWRGKEFSDLRQQKQPMLSLAFVFIFILLKKKKNSCAHNHH